MLQIFTLPGAQTIVDNSTDYASVWFVQFLPTVYVIVGLSVAVGLTLLIGSAIMWAVNTIRDKFIGGSSRGGYSEITLEEVEAARAHGRNIGYHDWSFHNK